MYQDKELVCRDCGESFIFTAGNRNSMQREVSKMNLSVANLAVMQERQTGEAMGPERDV